MSWCYCDFYAWASTVGYKSEKMAGWCSTSETYLTQRSSVANDLFGLELIYKSLGGEFWYDSSGWLTATPHCEWYGVGCSEDRVSFIKLDSNNLTGDLSLFGEYLDYAGDTGSLFELQELCVKVITLIHQLIIIILCANLFCLINLAVICQITLFQEVSRVGISFVIGLY